MPEPLLRAGVLPLLEELHMPSCLRDASPDAWGRRVLMYKRTVGKNADELDELICTLESASNRTGVLDFQYSSTEYIPRLTETVTLEQLHESTEMVTLGLPRSTELAIVLQYGTAVGGAGPKAVISTRDKEYVAKFSLNTDLYNIVKAEFIAMGLARIVGLVVSSVKLKTALNMSQIKVFLAAASDFKLSAKVAKEIVEHQSELIEKNGEKVCDEAKLPTLERQMFWGCQFMNPYTAE